VERVALLSHTVPEAVVGYRAGRALDARRFLGAAVRVAAELPPCRHVVNACADRYRFAVGFAACLLTGRISLLPSTRSPETIRRLVLFAPDAVCLTDEPSCDIELPQCQFPDDDASAAVPWPPPVLPATQLAAYVFTSGSTGAPVPHPKTVGRLWHCIQTEASRLGLGRDGPYAIVATVPPQHMYGFESTVLAPLWTGNALCAARPFYPADIALRLAAVPRPRLLVSTPFHLRALLSSDVAMPPIDLVVSATAPLATTLAADVETRLGAPLAEIYGSTETGQIASRRTAHGAEWQLWPGVRLELRDGRSWASGGHIEVPTPIGDVVETTAEGRFILRGRTADLVNIAGKRSSLSFLNHHLLAIPGVIDGTFFVRDEEVAPAGGIARLGALVVAPGLDAATISARLRERIDPVFLPRPLLLVEDMPRNATGKLPQYVLEALTGRA
jgi:acyl-coenzyme A synthetase/AMP-(fatty) acid ligase